MFKRTLYYTSLAITSIGLCACAPNPASLFPIKEGEAISLVKIVVTMDGKRESGFKVQCVAGFEDTSGEKIKAIRDKETLYYLMKTPAGEIDVALLACLANKTFYNKLRTYELKDLSFVAEAGKINYAGDLAVDWQTSKFNIGDFIGVGGFYVGDKQNGAVKIQVSEDLEAAREFLKKKELPIEGLVIQKVDFKEHHLLTQ